MTRRSTTTLTESITDFPSAVLSFFTSSLGLMLLFRLAHEYARAVPAVGYVTCLYATFLIGLAVTAHTLNITSTLRRMKKQVDVIEVHTQPATPANRWSQLLQEAVRQQQGGSR